MKPDIPACLDCGRWTHAKSWAIPPLRPNNRKQEVDILVVGEYPSAEDAEIGIPFQAEPYKELICHPLAQTPWEVVFTTGARCAYIHPEKKSKPSKKQLEICGNEFLFPMLKGMRPKCIWAIGAEAARLILNSELSLDKIRSLGVSYFTQEGCEDIPVVIFESPYNHSKWKSAKDGGKDLRPLLNRNLELTQRILQGNYKPERFDFTLITNCDEALKMGEFLKRDCYPVVGFDTEVGLQPNTNFAEQSERVSYLTSGLSGLERATGNYITFSVDHENWERRQVFKMLDACFSSGCAPIATTCFFDFGLIWWQANYDIFRNAPGYNDIALLSWAQNQTSTKNGLEDQLVGYLGWASYKAEMDEQGAKLEKLLTFEPDSLIQYVDYRHRKWHYYEEFMKYQGKDALGTTRLWYERYQTDDPESLTPSERFNINGYRLSLSYIKSLSYMSRYGIPVNVEKLKAFVDKNQAVADHYQNWLNAHPLTKKIFGVPEVNVKSGPQMHLFFEKTGLEARNKTEKTQQHQVDQDELLRQSNVDIPHFVKSDELKRLPRTDAGQLKAVVQDYMYATLKTRLHRDRNSKAQGLIDYALPLVGREGTRTTLTYDGEPLHWLHPWYKVGKLDGASSSRGGGGVNTGRISSVWPSAGNIAQLTDLRECFEVPSGWVYCEWDQSAIEPRVFAYLAGEERWIEVFKLQADPLTAKDPAADIYRRGWADYRIMQGDTWYTPGHVDKEADRPLAKILILRLCYDSSPNGITQQDGIPIEITTGYGEAFWATNKKLQAFAYKTRKQIIEHAGWLTACQGRRGQYRLFNNYRLEDDKHAHLPLWQLQRALRIKEYDAGKLRAGMNSLIQGSSADITLTAVNDLNDYLWENKIKWMATVETVHDNIGALVRESHVQEADKLVDSIMTDPARLDKWGIKIPFPRTGHRIMRTGFKIGPSKGALKEVR